MKNTYLFILIVLFFISISLPTASSRLSSKLSSLDAIQKKKHHLRAPKTIVERLAGAKSIVYYLGDIHGDIDKTLKALVYMKFLVETKVETPPTSGKFVYTFTWQADVKEAEHIVYLAQVGDMIDKGPNGDEVLAVLLKDGTHNFDYTPKETWGNAVKDTKRTVSITGTRPKDNFLITLGNHESETLLGRFVRESLYNKGNALPYVKCDGDARVLLKGTPLARIFGDTVFVHGGISKHWAGHAAAYKMADPKVTPDCTDTSTIAACTISGHVAMRGLNEEGMSLLWHATKYCATNKAAYDKFMELPDNERTFFQTSKTEGKHYNGDELEVDVAIFRKLTHKDATPTDSPLSNKRWINLLTKPNGVDLVKPQADLDATLGLFGAARMVVGHEPLDTVKVGGTAASIIGIDTTGKNALSLVKIEYASEKATKITSYTWATTKLNDDPTSKEEWKKE